MKNYLRAALLLLCIGCQPKEIPSKTNINSYTNEVMLERNKLKEEYLNPETSPIAKEEFESFKGLRFYDIDSNFRIIAKVELLENQQPFEMPTSTDRKPVYVKYANLHFTLKNQEHTLAIYQNIELTSNPEYVDYLFLPFTDLTSGFDTYGGGRYLDLRIPKTDSVVIDFNLCYHPYCAYNHDFSCPIPPQENHITQRISAGVRL